MLVKSTVNRSNRLRCGICAKHLPMKTSVYFELDEDGQFEDVLCTECVHSDPALLLESIHEHPFNLDD